MPASHYIIAGRSLTSRFKFSHENFDDHTCIADDTKRYDTKSIR
jgi:hypothetical protein